MLLYIGFCPLLLFTLAIDFSNECCYDNFTIMGLFSLMGYSGLCTICNGLESLRKNFASAGENAWEEGRRDVEMDGNAKEDVPDDELERLSLI